MEKVSIIPIQKISFFVSHILNAIMQVLKTQSSMTGGNANFPFDRLIRNIADKSALETQAETRGFIRLGSTALILKE